MPGAVTLDFGDRFLPTPSARRATRECRLQRGLEQHFYPRPPRGGRPCNPLITNRKKLIISTHALREEGDHPARRKTITAQYFYPRPPRGGRPRAPMTA